jgi:hypothetical protein
LRHPALTFVHPCQGFQVLDVQPMPVDSPMLALDGQSKPAARPRKTPEQRPLVALGLQLLTPQGLSHGVCVRAQHGHLLRHVEHFAG